MLPQFVRVLLGSPPPRGEGLNNWVFRAARVLHPYRDSAEIIELLEAATCNEPIRPDQSERAVESLTTLSTWLMDYTAAYLRHCETRSSRRSPIKSLAIKESI